MIERVDQGGWVSYRLNGVPHRPDGPARIWKDGDWDWALFGKWHRYYGGCRNWGDGWWIHGEQVK